MGDPGKAIQKKLLCSRDTIAAATGTGIALDAPGKVTQKKLLFSRDTIAVATSTGIALAVEQRPKIKAPSSKPEALAYNPNRAEVDSRNGFIAALKANRASHEEDAIISKDTIQQAEQSNKNLHAKIIADEGSKNDKTSLSSILKWINWVFFGVATVAGVAGLGISILSAGAALPAVFVAIGIGAAAVAALASIASGAMTIERGILDYQANRAEGRSVTNKATRYLNTQTIRVAWEEMKDSIQAVLHLWQDLFQVAKNWHAAAVNR